MADWFDRLPIHRKLVALAVAVSAMSLLMAGTGLLLVDVWRYRTSARDDASTLAQVIAENISTAAIVGDTAAAQEILATVRARIAVTRACIYTPEGRLFTQYQREGADACPSANPQMETFTQFGVSQPILRNGRALGAVYVERDLPDLWRRVAVTASAGGAMLGLASVLAVAIAQRMTRTISRPIARLAAAARHIGRDSNYVMPTIETPQDEVGELVRSFQGMVATVHETNGGLLREIEERKKMEALRERALLREREASRLKDEFLAAVSHELRTPLNAIFGWSQLLATGKLDEITTAKAIDSIARNAQAQARVIEDLVDVSRIVTGKLLLRLQPVDLRAPIEAALDVVRPSAQAKGIELVVSLAETSRVVSGDPERLQQIVWNLLSNAVKFTPSNGRITLVTRDRGTICEMEISDTGAGIAPEFLPLVFDRFRQADGSSSREHGGLGLGLSIVKDLVELHGGSAHVSSLGLGQGSTFTIAFPVLVGPQLRVPAASNAEGDAVLSGTRVLVVDDNTDALEVVALALSAAGARVRAVTSGIEALQEWQREPADVLLCDLAMPQIDGFDLLHRIRENDRVAGRVTRAVALSAHATAEYRERSREAGFLHYLAKPYSRSDLVRAVAAALSDYG